MQNNKHNKKEWSDLDALENQAHGLFVGGFLSNINEDEWIIHAAELEEGCSVTAGSLDSEAFFKEVEENRKKAERILDEMGIKRVE